MRVQIVLADFSDLELERFIQAHLRDIAPTAPPESQHAFGVAALDVPGIRLWVAKDGNLILGMGALAMLSNDHAEIKSMRTEPAYRGRGVAAMVLGHLIADAESLGVTRVSLETGSMEFFASARALYAKFGFVPCPPFNEYGQDPNSSYMTRVL